MLTDGETQLLAKLDPIIHDGGRGLLEGGFHTPNHRWAIAALLATCGKMYGEEDLTQAAFAYLNEGIDCNADGEYSEKSAGNYNGVNNQAMLLLADALGDGVGYDDLMNVRMDQRGQVALLSANTMAMNRLADRASAMIGLVT